MIITYNFQKEIINNLDLINKNANSIYNYKKLNFLAKLKNQNEYLIIIFHGHIGQELFNKFKQSKKLEERAIFRGYNYEINNTDLISISDFLLDKYEDYKVNWTLSTKKYNSENIYLELFNYIINHKKYKNVLFFGTSAGGYPSIKFACKLNQIALVSNAQLYLEDYSLFHTHLKNIIKKNDDQLYYENQDIEKLITDYKPKKLVIYNNIKDYTYQDTIKFSNFTIQNNFNQNIIDFMSFEYNGIIEEGKNHHVIQFPQNTFLNIIQEIFKNTNT